MRTKQHRILSLLITLVMTAVNPLTAETANLSPISTMGKGERVLKDGKEAVLFEHQGAGCLNHFWFGGNFKGVENTRIRYYVDGEKVASIDMDLYMGHGIGFNDNHAPWTTKYIGKANSFSAYRFHDEDPIFFQNGLRLTCRCGETEHGETEGKKGYLDPPNTNYTVYTWMYQW